MLAKDIISDAYRSIGMFSDGASVDGNEMVAGIGLLNERIAQNNIDGQLAWTEKTVTTIVNSKTEVTIGLPDGDIKDSRPATIKRLYATESNIEIDQVASQDLPKYSSDISATLRYFSYVSSYPYGIIRFNTRFSGLLTICYSEILPNFEMGDELNIPPEYIPFLKNDLAYYLAIRYGLSSETISTVKMIRDENLNSIKRNTAVKNPLLYSDASAGWNIFNMGL